MASQQPFLGLPRVPGTKGAGAAICRPKKPLNSFMVFMKSKRPDIAAANPQWKAKQVASEVAAIWGRLSDPEKEPYIRQAAELKDSRGAIVANWLPTKPKKPMNAFVLFSKDQRPKLMALKPDLPGKDVVHQLGLMWRGMTEQQKKPYENQALQCKARYLEDCVQWKAQAKMAVKPKGKPGRPRCPANKKNQKLKKPATAFQLFAAANRGPVHRQNPGWSLGEVCQEVARQWRELEAGPRAEYDRLHNEAVTKYQAKMAAMQSTGNGLSAPSAMRHQMAKMVGNPPRLVLMDAPMLVGAALPHTQFPSVQHVMPAPPHVTQQVSVPVAVAPPPAPQPPPRVQLA